MHGGVAKSGPGALLLLAACTGQPDPPDDRPPGDTDDTLPSESGGTGTPPTCAPGLILGTGELQFEPLNGGDSAEITYGPQGGWHVWTSARVTGTTPALRILAELTDLETGVQLAGVSPLDIATLGMADWDGCTGTFVGQRAILDDWLPPKGPLIDYICGIDGTPLRLTLGVESLSGTTPPTTATPTISPELTTSVDVIARGDPYFVKNFCQ